MNGTGIYRNHIRQRFSSLMEPRLIDAHLSLDSAEFSREGYLFLFRFFFFAAGFFLGSWFYAFLFL